MTELAMPRFVVLYDNGDVAIKTGGQVSNMYDMADCDYMEDVKQILSVDENGSLVPITFGPQKRLHPEEVSFIYATQDIYAGNRRVGVISLTDH